MTETLAQKFDATAKRFLVIVPQDNGYSSPQAMQRIIDHFNQLKLNAEFVLTKDRVPTKDPEGAYTLITHDAKAELLAPKILNSHYGLTLIPK